MSLGSTVEIGENVVPSVNLFLRVGDDESVVSGDEIPRDMMLELRAFESSHQGCLSRMREDHRRIRRSEPRRINTHLFFRLNQDHRMVAGDEIAIRRRDRESPLDRKSVV